MNNTSDTIFYRRRLPHWQPDDAIVFVTYRLANSLPKHVLAALQEEKLRLIKQSENAKLPRQDKMLKIDKIIFGKMDTALNQEFNRNVSSPQWLTNPQVARVVKENLLYWHGKRYQLYRYVIMPNHIHVLIEPLIVPPSVRRYKNNLNRPITNDTIPVNSERYYPLPQIIKSLKGYTSRKANEILGRTGSFWARESFDHWVRDEAEYDKIITYIDCNPIKAGLCAQPEQWIWSSSADG